MAHQTACRATRVAACVVSLFTAALPAVSGAQPASDPSRGGAGGAFQMTIVAGGDSAVGLVLAVAGVTGGSVGGRQAADRAGSATRAGQLWLTLPANAAPARRMAAALARFDLTVTHFTPDGSPRVTLQGQRCTVTGRHPVRAADGSTPALNVELVCERLRT